MAAKKQTKAVVGLRRQDKRTKKSILSPRNVREIEQRYQITKLRRDGFTNREIMDVLGISQGTVTLQLQKALNIAINETAETTEESRQLQVERLDQLLKTYTPFATEWHKEERIEPVTNQRIIVECPPDPKYARLILDVEMRRAKLLALDVPETKKLDVTGVREYIGVDVDKV